MTKNIVFFFLGVFLSQLASYMSVRGVSNDIIVLSPISQPPPTASCERCESPLSSDHRVNFLPVPSGPESFSGDEDDEQTGSLTEVSAEECASKKYSFNGLLATFLDIDFEKLILQSNVNPQISRVIDIGVWASSELRSMAIMGFTVDAYEPEPRRFELIQHDLVTQLTSEQRARVTINHKAVSDTDVTIFFKSKGKDSYIMGQEEVRALEKHNLPLGVTAVSSISVANILKESSYYWFKIDTQGFDTRILENLVDTLKSEAKKHVRIPFIEFEFSPRSEVDRAGRTKDDHIRTFKKLIDLGYDVFLGACLKTMSSMRSSRHMRKSALSMFHSSQAPLCVDEFVQWAHHYSYHPFNHRSLRKNTTDMGMWCELLAVKKGTRRAEYFRTKGWMYATRTHK